MAGALLLSSPALGSGDAFAQDPFATFDVVLNNVAINADQTAEYEEVLGRLRDALQGSDDPVRNQMAASWRVLRLPGTLPSGEVLYIHVIEPVDGLTGEDYGIFQTLYDEFPEEGQTLYEIYQDAFSQNLGASGGNVVIDMGQ